MRILQIVNNLTYGGLERVVVELASALNRDGHTSLICTLEGAGALETQARRRGIRVVSLHKRDGVDLGSLIRLIGVMRRERIDVVHTHNMGPLVYGGIAARLAGIRTVVNTRHGREEKTNPRWIWNLNGAIVAISEDARARLNTCNDIGQGTVQVIHNGIDITRFNGHHAADLRRELGVADGHRIIGTIARLATEKDQRTLLRAFAELRRVQEQLTLLIVGDGELRSELEHLANDLHIANEVRFLGFRPDVSEILGVFDVFVLSSVTEGLSMTILEAMAAGKPVVATRVGGTPEVVQDGLTGLLVPPEAPDAMAKALSRCLNEPHLADDLGSAGRVRAHEHFSLARMVNDYKALYEDLSHH